MQRDPIKSADGSTYNRAMVRFWILFWPMLFGGLTAAAIVGGALIGAYGMLASTGDGTSAFTLFSASFVVGLLLTVQTGFFAATVLAILLARQYAYRPGMELLSAVLFGGVIGALGGLLSLGAGMAGVIGLVTGAAAGVAMRGIGIGIAGFWRDRPAP